MPHRFPTAARWLAGLVFALLCAVVAAYAFTVLYGQPHAGNPLQMKFAASGLDVPAHFFGGGLALLLAPLQMSGWVRRRVPRLHRLGGGLYAGGVLIAGLAGLSLALHAQGGAATLACSRWRGWPQRASASATRWPATCPSTDSGCGVASPSPHRQ